MGEIMARWALVIGFGLLGSVTALAAVMIVMFPQPGNVGLLTVTSVVSLGVAFYI
jgi:hypothetical protein